MEAAVAIYSTVTASMTGIATCKIIKSEQLTKLTGETTSIQSTSIQSIQGQPITTALRTTPWRAFHSVEVFTLARVWTVVASSTIWIAPSSASRAWTRATPAPWMFLLAAITWSKPRPTRTPNHRRRKTFPNNSNASTLTTRTTSASSSVSLPTRQ